MFGKASKTKNATKNLLKREKNILKQLNGAIDTLSQSTKADDVAKLKKIRKFKRFIK